MVSQREAQTQRGSATPREEGASPIETAGWGLVGVALTVFGAAALLLMQGTASSRAVGILQATFVALVTGGFALLGMSRPIERLLFRWQLRRKGPGPSADGGSWEEHWERLMQLLHR